MHIEALLSRDVGVVNRLDAGVTPWDQPRLATAYAQVCDTWLITGSRHAIRPAGMAPTTGAARLCALGEAVERYSSALVPSSRLYRARTSDVEENGAVPVAPPEWRNRPVHEPPTSWVPGWRLRPSVSSHGGDDAPEPGTGTARPIAEAAWLAASRVYLDDIDTDCGVVPPTSTGLAAHPDPWQALRSAMCEVVERDAVMRTWLTRGPTRPVTAFGLSGQRSAPVDFSNTVEDYRTFALPAAGSVPTVLGVALGRSGQPPVAVGAATAPDLAAATRKALTETAQTMRWAASMRAEGRVVASADGLTDLDDHVAYYLDPSRRPAFDFLLAGGGRPIPVDLAGSDAGADDTDDADLARRDVSRLVAALDADGFAVFCADVTCPEARAVGIWVIRAVVPGLYPLFVGATPLPEHPRVPLASVVNPDPHPFP